MGDIRQRKRRLLNEKSGMRIDELPNGRRYYCNEIGFETEFDRLIFVWKIVSGKIVWK
jgi:hypothetical protein